MKSNGKTTKKSTVKLTKNEEYLAKFFTMLKKTESVSMMKERSPFNNSEMRLLGEVLTAEKEGRRIISTQLAVRLGVTRSAVSQMVNKLEARGVVKRMPDDVDRKIAYIELTPKAVASYKAEKEACCVLVGDIIAELGQEKIDQLLALNVEFIETVAKLRK